MTTYDSVSSGILGIWHSPIDQVAVIQAQSLQRQQPQASISYNEDFTLISIFNFGQYITVAGGVTAADAALDDLFNAMGSPAPGYGIGGLAYILQQSYQVNAYDPASKKHKVPDQCNILGCGTGGIHANAGSTSFYHFQIAPQAIAPNTSRFLSCEGNHTDGGKWFRGLAFEWSQTNAQAGDVCIYAATWNCNATDCTFTNCPTAFYATGESSGLERCMIYYSAGSPNNAVAVYLQAVQSFAIGPGEFQQDAIGTKSGPTGCTCIALGGGGGGGNLVHGVISNLHLSEWSYGIHYGLNPGVSGTHVTSVQAHCYLTCVMMQPPSSGNNQINGEKYTSCTFEKAADGATNSPIIFIDTNGQGNGGITDIEFLNCSVYSIATASIAGLYCYQITSGSNIRIIGGTASNAGPGAGSAGIAITPTIVSGGPPGPGRITILGVDINPSYPNVSGGGAQTYALVITANLQDVVTVDDCRMANYGSGGPILVTGNVNNNLFIRNCQGYNDQNTIILSGTAHLPVTSVVSAGTAGTLSGGINYYGPSLVIFTNNTATGGLTLTINSVSQTVPVGAFVTVYLASPWDTIQFSHTAAAFSWIGK